MLSSFKNFIKDNQPVIVQLMESELLREEAGGADYEPAIVMGYFKAQGKKVPTATVLGITQSAYDKVLDDTNLFSAGTKIAKTLLPKVGTGTYAIQLGSGSFPLTSEWKKTGANNTTPKTDLKLGSSRISLKIGPAQLMSGGKAESLATFYAAIKEVPALAKTKEAKAVLNSFDSFVERGLTKEGAVDEYIKGAKKGKDKIIAEADKAHKEMMSQLTDLFNKSPEFKLAFTKEAMSGIHKFGYDSDAAAEFFLVGNKSGTSVSYHSIADTKYVSKVASVIKPTVRFKSSSQKSGGEKTGKYSYWSVVSLIVNKMDSINEQTLDECNQLLNEGHSEDSYTSLVENILTAAWLKLKSFITATINSVKAAISTSIDALMEFLGFDVEIDVNGLDQNIVMPA